MKMNLVIGQGIGPAKFLMTTDEIVDLFGEPSEIDESEKDMLTYMYDDMYTDFTFDASENEDGQEQYVLTLVHCYNPDYTLDNKIKFGDSEEDFIKYTRSLKAADPKVDIDKENNVKFLYFEDLGLMGVFDQEGLADIQIEYWEDEEPEE